MTKPQLRVLHKVLSNTMQMYVKTIDASNAGPQTAAAIEYQTAAGAAILVLAPLIAAIDGMHTVTFGPEDWN